MRFSISSFLTRGSLLWVAACSATSAPAPPARNVAEASKLESARAEYRSREAELARAPHDELQSCRTTSGDCLLSVAERRDELVRRFYLNACRDPDPEKQGPCIIAELEASDHRPELSSYYGIENWCSQKLLECASRAVNDAAHLAARERVAERRGELEGAAESVKAARAPEFAHQKATFVRALLPPNAQEACPLTTPASCQSALEAPSAELEAELAKAPASYSQRRALDAFALVQRARASCYDPELTCLLGTLPAYGATAESDKLLRQNLTLLEAQQQLSTKVAPEAAEGCLSSGVREHSDRIVRAYRAYATSPVAQPFVQLQKAFLLLHKSELDCLTRQPVQKRH